MKMILRQRIFSWLDSYDVYGEDNSVLFNIQGRFALGHYLEIYDTYGQYVGKVEQEIFHLMPQFNLYQGESLTGKVKQEFTFFKPSYTINDGAWAVSGNWMGWDYEIIDHNTNMVVASISKDIFNFTDVYIIDVIDPQSALFVLMVILAIDAANCNGD